MLAYHQSLLLHCQVQDPALAGGSLLRDDVIDRDPVRVLQVQRMKHRVGDNQQSLSSRVNGHHNMTGGMAGCRDRINAGHDFALSVKEGQLILNRFEVPARDGDVPLGGFCKCHLRGPEIPLGLPDVVARVGVDGLALVVWGAAHVAWMGMRDDDGINGDRFNACRPQVLPQLACAGRHIARPHIHEHLMLTGVDVQTGERRRDIVYWQAVLTKSLFDLCFWRVGKKVSKRIVDAAIADGDTLKIPQLETMTPDVHGCSALYANR